MRLAAEQYAEYVSNTQMTTIPGKSMLLTWRHWIVTTTLHDLFQDDVVNMGYAITADKANVFNRGGVSTQFQLYDNYGLSTSELVSQIHLQMNGQWSNIFLTSSGPTICSSPLNNSSQKRTWEAGSTIQHPKRFNWADLRSSTPWMAQHNKRWLHIACSMTS